MRTLRLTLIACIGVLALAPAAHATLNLTAGPDAVVVNGDDGQNRIKLTGGSTSGGDNYAFQFYSEDGEPVNLGDSGCASNGGSPVETIYCGNSGFSKAVFNLAGGSDTISYYNDPILDVISELTVDFGAGNDTNGGGFKGIPTTMLGGEGDDRLSGQDGPTSVVDGGPGADTLIGGGAMSGETLRGGPGNDNINGLAGNDAIFGDDGNDALTGGAESDTITGGPGVDDVLGDDTYNAFSGNDTLLLVDGERDTGTCGFGADTAEVDAIDVLGAGDCEVVKRSGGGGNSPSAEVALGKPSKVSAKRRTISFSVACPATATGGCTGKAGLTLSFVEKGKKRKAKLKSVSFRLQPGKREKMSRKLSKRTFKRLRKAGKRKLTVSATSRDAAGASFKSTRSSTLRVG